MSNEAKHSHDDHHDDHAHGHDLKFYFKTYLILVGLFIVSVLGPEVAPHVTSNVHVAKIIVLFTAFGIALIKAYYVVVNFMHINAERPFIRYMMAVMLLFMVVFFFGTSPDVMKHEGTNWDNQAAKSEIMRALEAEKARVEHGGAHGAAPHGEAAGADDAHGHGH